MTETQKEVIEVMTEGVLVFLLFVPCGPFPSMVHSLDSPLLVWFVTNNLLMHSFIRMKSIYHDH